MIDGGDTQTIKQTLNSKGINISVSSPSSTRLDAEHRQLPALLRASPHYYNSEAELERFVGAIDSLRAG